MHAIANEIVGAAQFVSGFNHTTTQPPYFNSSPTPRLQAKVGKFSQTTGTAFVLIPTGASGEFYRVISQLKDEEFQLHRPVIVSVSKEADGYTVSNSELNVHAFGTTPAEAQDEWENVLIDLYLSYAETPENELALSGAVMRDRLSAVVSEV